MSLFYRTDTQFDSFCGYLPQGKAYRGARIKGDVLNGLAKASAKGFELLTEKMNKVSRDLFLTKETIFDNQFIEQYKIKYGIPNEIFYEDKDENPIDIYVIKYLMRGNTDRHFVEIAKMYGIDVEILDGETYTKYAYLPAPYPFLVITDILTRETDPNVPMKLPYRYKPTPNALINTIVIKTNETILEGLPYEYPFLVGENRKFLKLKKIFEKIKPVHKKIIYTTRDSIA